MIRPPQALVFTLFAALVFPYSDVQAQAGNELERGLQIISPAHPVWLVEQPDAKGSSLSARTYGDSAYGDYHTNANLEISCTPQNPTASFTLLIAPAPLGFDSDPFEGPDATAQGPMRITAGARPGVDHSVSGIWTDGGVFQVGAVFAFSTPVPRDELAYWASDASRGQSLMLALEPAKKGGKRLTATFSLPTDNDGLKKVIQPCLDALAAKSVKS